MARRPTSRYGTAPPEHAPAKAPHERAVPRTPKGNPMAQAGVPSVARAPKGHGVGAPPNPRKPKLVRDINGGALLDLFAIFPDLPWPRRPVRNFQGRLSAREGRLARRALGRRVR